MGWVSGSLGVCLGFHRLLTHASFETYRRYGDGCLLCAEHWPGEGHADHVASPSCWRTIGLVIRNTTRIRRMMEPGGVI